MVVIGALMRSVHRIDLRNPQWIKHITVVFVVEQIVCQPVLSILTGIHNTAELWVIVIIAVLLFISLFDIYRVLDVLWCLSIWSYRRLLAILSYYVCRTSHICLWCSFKWANLRSLRLHYLTMCRLIDNDGRWVWWSISAKELCKVSDWWLLLCDYAANFLLLMGQTSCLLLLVRMHGRHLA